MNPSLIQLSQFIPVNDAERSIYNIESDKYIIQKYLNDANSSYTKGKYYLGGQIQLDPNDPLTSEIIKRTWKAISDAGNYYCNSFEYASMLNSTAGLTSIEKIVEKYIKVQKLRVLQELEKTKLATDVNKEIMRFI
jgi:hypothetical protein